MRRLLLLLTLILLAITIFYAVSAFTLTNKIGPSDSVSEDQIKVYDDKVVIHVKGVEWSRYAPTGSMLPFINENCNGLEIVPSSPDEIHVGDIISYENSNGELIVHQVVNISKDSKGLYYILKGFANATADPAKVRFSDIRYKTIGVIC